jgi:hypothetical protein
MMTNIEVVTDIAAPAQTVWAELASVAMYGDWNPFMTSVEGRLAVGGRLKIRLVPPGGRPMTFRPTVTKFDVGSQLEWIGRLVVRGVFDGRHSFVLEDVGGGVTRLTQAEEFTGLLVPLTGAMLKRTRAGFHAMNEALRLRAEAAHVTEVVR